jgi:hypothetical protein
MKKKILFGAISFPCFIIVSQIQIIRGSRQREHSRLSFISIDEHLMYSLQCQHTNPVGEGGIGVLKGGGVGVEGVGRRGGGGRGLWPELTNEDKSYGISPPTHNTIFTVDCRCTLYR